MVTEIKRCEEGFVDISNDDKETKSAGQNFCEKSTVGTMMEPWDTDLLQR